MNIADDRERIAEFEQVWLVLWVRGPVTDDGYEGAN